MCRMRISDRNGLICQKPIHTKPVKIMRRGKKRARERKRESERGRKTYTHTHEFITKTSSTTNDRTSVLSKIFILSMQTDELKRQKVNICDCVASVVVVYSLWCILFIGIEGTCLTIAILCQQKLNICHSLNIYIVHQHEIKRIKHTQTHRLFIWIGDTAWANTQCCQRKITSRLKWGYQYSSALFL